MRDEKGGVHLLYLSIDGPYDVKSVSEVIVTFVIELAEPVGKLWEVARSPTTSILAAATMASRLNITVMAR